MFINLKTMSSELTIEDKKEIEQHIQVTQGFLDKHRQRMQQWPELAEDPEMKQIEQDYIEIIEVLKQGLTQCPQQ